jgi:hypothetical protein
LKGGATVACGNRKLVLHDDLHLRFLYAIACVSVAVL